MPPDQRLKREISTANVLIAAAGGMSNYPTYTHGHEAGFLFAWVSWLSYVVITPIEIQAILQYGVVSEILCDRGWL